MVEIINKNLPDCSSCQQEATGKPIEIQAEKTARKTVRKSGYKHS